MRIWIWKSFARSKILEYYIHAKASECDRRCLPDWKFPVTNSNFPQSQNVHFQLQVCFLVNIIISSTFSTLQFFFNRAKTTCVTIQNWAGKNFSKKVLKKLCCKTKVFWWNTEFSALPYQPLWHHRILAWIKTSILPLMKIDAKWAFQKRSAFLFSNWNMQQIESWKKENITFSNWCRPKALDRT